jgi:signal transduction histidine kinase
VGVSSSAGQNRPEAGRRSIRFTFAATVAAPTVCLALLWGLAVGFTLPKVLAGRGLTTAYHRDLVELELLAGAGVVVVLVAVLLMGSFARRLTRDVRDLTTTARRLADEGRPEPAERLRGGMHAAQPEGSPLRYRENTAEIAGATAAIASLQHTAAAAAASESSLRDGLRQVFVSLARRNQSLLQRQLRLIDALEQKASDPAALADLFSLDHLTTRMRRHAESLAILSGAAPGRAWREPVPVIDVIRGAMAEVEDYKRVAVLTRSQDSVAGSAVADMIHLLAELMENATLFSPSGTQVEVRAGRVANGFAVEIDDRGLGIEPGQLNEINQQLASPADFDLANADRLGLFVGGKLAARHNVRVALRASPYGGTTAIVLMPNNIVVPAAITPPESQPAIGRPARLDLRDTDALALVGRRSPPAALPMADRHAAQALEQAADKPGLPTRNGLAGRNGLASRSDLPGRNGLASRDGLPGRDGLASVDQPAGTYRGLPRRTRQANLSPHLRDSPLTAARPPASDEPAAPSDARAPEQARDLAASLQSGWQRGRETDLPDTWDTPGSWDTPTGRDTPGTRDGLPEPDTGTARGQDSDAPQSEEG